MNTMYWKVEYPDGFDHEKFTVDFSRGDIESLRGCKIGFIDSPEFSLAPFFLKAISQMGLKSYMETAPIMESLLSPSFSISDVDSFFSYYLESLNITDELIIIDPYFYPNFNNPAQLTNYTTRIIGLLNNYSQILKDVRVITSSRVTSNTTKSTVENAIKSLNPHIRTHHKTTNDIHDRFWISNNRSKGILSGTSLNGFGKKYCIVDFLDDQDVADIIQELSNSSLI
jgi:hypothetical protein